jgi:hypothetical protein
MEYTRYFAELAGILLGVIAGLFVIALFLRSHKIPECYSCGAMKVRPSRVVGLWDTVGLAFQVRPYRCGGCRERFYGFVFFANRSKIAVAQAPHAERVVKVAFRFRYGLPDRVSIRVIPANAKAISAPVSPAILEI